MTKSQRDPKSHPQSQPSASSPKVILTLFAKGFCMGAADVVPGVSGGTMALILGIYENLIYAIKAIDATFLRNILKGRFRVALLAVPLGFLIPLGMGIVTAIFTLAKGLSWLLVHQPVAIWSFFFGLVLASALVVARRIQCWTISTVTCMVIFAAGAYVVVGLVPVHTPESLPFIFLCGAIAICAMILPGISGSFILVLLGKYHYVLEAVGRLDLVVLTVFTAGTATGIMLFVRLLNWLLRHYYPVTMAALTGLMIGSLRKIWPWKAAAAELSQTGLGDVHRLVNVFPHQISAELIIAIGLALVGGLMVLVLQRFAEK